MPSFTRKKTWRSRRADTPGRQEKKATASLSGRYAIMRLIERGLRIQTVKFVAPNKLSLAVHRGIHGK